jgi:hypothetical protein
LVWAALPLAKQDRRVGDRQGDDEEERETIDDAHAP